MRHILTISLVLIAYLLVVLTDISFAYLLRFCVALVFFFWIFLFPETARRIRRSQRFPAHPEFVLFDATSPSASPLVENVRSTTVALSDVGFLARANVFRSDEGPQMFVSVFENEPQRVVARLLTIQVQAGKLKKTQTALVFVTELSDGREITTANSSVLPLLPRMPGHSGAIFSEIKDPIALYQIHEAIVQRAIGTAVRLAPKLEDPVAYQRDAAVKEMAHQVDTGYLYYESTQDDYRVTWKGAFIMAAKLLWPIGAIRRTLNRKRNAKLLQELGVTITPPRNT